MALIYILEDDKDICDIEAMMLRSAGHDTKKFFDAKSFMVGLTTRVPDLVVIDIMLPDSDGYSVVERIRTTDAFCKLPIIMVTGKSKEFDMIRGIDAGADDYIKKPFSIAEFITRVKALLRRAGCVDNVKSIFRVGNIVMDDARHKVYVNDEVVQLTCTEYEMLKLLMNNPGIVLRRDEILNKIWGSYYYDEETRKIDMHIKSIRKKMKSESEHIKTIRSVGYVIA